MIWPSLNTPTTCNTAQAKPVAPVLPNFQTVSSDTGSFDPTLKKNFLFELRAPFPNLHCSWRCFHGILLQTHIVLFDCFRVAYSITHNAFSISISISTKTLNFDLWSLKKSRSSFIGLHKDDKIFETPCIQRQQCYMLKNPPAEAFPICCKAAHRVNYQPHYNGVGCYWQHKKHRSKRGKFQHWLNFKTSRLFFMANVGTMQSFVSQTSTFAY